MAVSHQRISQQPLYTLIKETERNVEMIKRICLWSGPRNVSTALMYAFAQRSDTRVIDEPLYAHYLHTKYGATAAESTHPATAEVIASMSTDATIVVREVILGPCDKPVLFMKQMAHHLIKMDLDFLQTDDQRFSDS